MNIKSGGGVRVIASPLLDGIHHGFSSCSDGESPQKINMGYDRGEDMATVRAHRASLVTSCGIMPPYPAGDDVVTSAKQIHSDKIEYINAQNAADAFECDGFVTDCGGVTIGVKTADCVPILFASADGGIVGAVHAGWRGAALGIGALAVEMMTSLGADIDGIRAVIGPAIDADSYHVGDDFEAELYSRLSRSRSEAVRANARELSAGAVIMYPDGPHADIPALCERTLRLAGVRGENIDNTRISTYKESGRYFSHRAYGCGEHGVMMAVIQCVGV